MSNPSATGVAAVHAETTRTLLRTRSCLKLLIGDKVEVPVTFQTIPAIWGRLGWEELELRLRTCMVLQPQGAIWTQCPGSALGTAGITYLQAEGNE